MSTANKCVLLFFIAMIVGVRGFAAEKEISLQTQRAMREAENLSLLKDRSQACGVLIRTIKKANASESQVLREKLSQLSKFFYTDKGFQEYLLGKGLFEKQKYLDAIEKLTEAEDLEKGNIDVLHFLALSQLWLKKVDLADTTNKLAMGINPLDLDVLRDHLAILISLENWEEAAGEGQTLSKEFSDPTAITEYFWARALLQTGALGQGEKMMAGALAKDPNLPEAYYWLSSKEVAQKEVTKFMAKYVELCYVKTPRILERDPSSCSHLEEAKKVVAMIGPSSPKTVLPKKNQP